MNSVTINSFLYCMSSHHYLINLISAHVEDINNTVLHTFTYCWAKKSKGNNIWSDPLSYINIWDINDQRDPDTPFTSERVNVTTSQFLLFDGRPRGTLWRTLKVPGPQSGQSLLDSFSGHVAWVGAVGGAASPADTTQTVCKRDANVPRLLSVGETGYRSQEARGEPQKSSVHSPRPRR